jgi:predicted flavoprotein YhiN
VTGVLLADGLRIDADAVVLCAGGPACAAAGGTPSGIELARRAGHAIVPPVPAGVPLVTREEWPRRCTGVRIEGARLRLTASARLPQETSAESHGLEARAMRLRLTASARLPQEASAESHGLEVRATSLSGPGESSALAARSDSRGAGRVRAITIETRGDLLFTHRGVSGPSVLDISGAIARRLAVGEEAMTLRASLTDEDRADVWEERLRAWSAEHGRRLVRSLVAEHLPAAVAAAACAAAGVGAEDRAARLTRDVRRALAAWLAAAPLTVVATEGMERAIVTAGGVARDEVAPRTLASHIVAGLHLAGEVLDVDGPCGGFNLTWAFASGRLAGEHAARG